MIKSLFRFLVTAFMMFVGFIAGCIVTTVVMHLASVTSHVQLLMFAGGVAGAWLARRITVRSLDVSVGARPGRAGRGSGPSYPWPHEGARVPTSTRSSQTSSSSLPEGEVFLPDRYVYGRIGGTMGDADFSQGNISAGLAGEVKTSKIIEDVMRRAGGNIYLFRGLSWPGSKSADIDFIVATARRTNRHLIVTLWLIDAKQWKRGAYSWDGEMCHLDGQPYHEIKFANAMASVRELFRHTVPMLHANVVIHGATSTRNLGRPAMSIMTKDEFQEKLEFELIDSDFVELPVDVGQKLASLVKVAQ